MTESKTVADMDTTDDDGCSICKEGDASSDNPIVYCEKCNVGVHAGCYGNPLVRKIPDDEWLCQLCLSGEEDAKCQLCPLKGGAMKRTTDWKWCHLTCAQWIPEVFFRQPDGREPVDILSVPTYRWNQTCQHCKSNEGVCMQCSEPGCKTTFHITCGVKNSIYLEYKKQRNGVDQVIALCEDHTRKYERMAKENVTKAGRKGASRR